MKTRHDNQKYCSLCVFFDCRVCDWSGAIKQLASDVFESFSAGTELKDHINPDAVRLMKQLYGIDMEATQRPKLLEGLPAIDVVVTMGCNVECPYLPCKRRENWGLDDPTGKPDDEFIKVIKVIETKIQELRIAFAK